MLGVRGLLTLLRSEGDTAVAEHSSRYFKTGPGEYGESDKFLGLRMPQIRSLLKDTYPRVDQTVALKLLKNPYHEVRMYATLWLVKAYSTAKEDAARQQIYDTYCNQFEYVNNWDLVDVSAPKVTGEHLLRQENPEQSMQVLRDWCLSDHLWTRRIGVLSTRPFIRANDFLPTMSLSKLLLDEGEQHDLMHKAVGWMLREVGKRDEDELLTFLDENAHRMPRVMLRYSIEKLSNAKRKEYMDAAKRIATSQVRNGKGEKRQRREE